MLYNLGVLCYPDLKHLLECAIMYDGSAAYDLSIENFHSSSENVNLVPVHVLICFVFLCL